VGFNADEIQSLFQATDDDNDGVIEFEELWDFWITQNCHVPEQRQIVGISHLVAKFRAIYCDQSAQRRRKEEVIKKLKEIDAHYNTSYAEKMLNKEMETSLATNDSPVNESKEDTNEEKKQERKTKTVKASIKVTGKKYMIIKRTPEFEAERKVI